ncbi:hypothetical protein M514_00221 [Trichuris suis]|uniref:Uncharacterized protein n=1 Tax=Trichuris suis TaxID=68888 RepID=A0A085MS86_9BILA|nr:hypothetical protein M514_00221 [Trichuris suis]
MANSPSAEDSSESEVLLPQTDDMSERSVPPLANSDDTRLPVSPGENSASLYYQSTAATISRTPSLGSDVGDLKSFGSTWTESEQSSIMMPEDTSFSNMSSFISESVGRDSKAIPSLSDNRGRFGSKAQWELGQSLNSGSVDCVSDVVSNLSSEVETSLSVAEHEIAQLSVNIESALCREPVEISEITESIHETEDDVCNLSIKAAETAVSVEAERKGGKAPRKVRFELDSELIDDSSVVAPSSSPKQKKSVGTKRQQRTTKGLNTAKSESRGDDAPVASRTRSRTTCQPQKEAAAAPVAATKIDKPAVKRVARSTEVEKAEPSSGRSRATTKTEKKSTTSKNAKGRRFHEPEGKPLVGPRSTRAQKH